MGSGEVAALLLAAGESTRMGSPKPLLPWLGTTLIAYQVEQLLRAGVGPLVVVLGYRHEEVAAALRGLPEATIALNPDYRRGRTTSLRRGIEALPEGVEHLLLHSVDQPRRAETIKRLVTAHREGHDRITVPTYQGRRGHPPMLSGSLCLEVASLSEERQGLKEILRHHLSETREVDLETPEVLLNLNTPEEYRQAVAYFQRESPPPGRPGFPGWGS